MTKGKLIIIDSGSDGSGKATQTALLVERLKQEGYPVQAITFPDYESPACEPVKMYLNGEFGTGVDEVNAYVASTFFAIDRFASFKKHWKKAYESGAIIISDRYTTSNMIHQGIKMERQDREAYLDWLTTLEFEHFGLPKPDLTIFLNVSPQMTKKLRENRPNKITGESKQDIHESNEAYLEQCYYNGIELADHQRWSQIHCDDQVNLRTIEDIHEEIYELVKTIL